jgi:MFS family permease
MITFFLCLLSVLASTLSPLLAANTLTLLVYYKGQHSITDMALLTGYHLLGVGISGFFVVPLARVWGKRWLILLGTLIIIISSIWGGLSGENYNSLVAARFFQVIRPFPTRTIAARQADFEFQGYWSGTF